MPKDFAPIQNKLCDRSIGFNFATGKIHDTNGDIGRKATSWRVARDPFTDPFTGIL